MIKEIFFCLAMISIGAAAQSQVRDSRTTIDTSIRAAVQVESDLSTSDAGDAIESYFDSMHIEKEKGKGFIIKKSMGYMLFKRAKADAVSDALDFYFVVETKKQKGNDASTVYIAASRGFNNFISPENDKDLWQQLQNFAAYMQSNYFEQYKLNTKLASVNKDLDKKRKRLDDVLKEKYGLETDISNDSLQNINLNEELLKLKAKKP